MADITPGQVIAEEGEKVVTGDVNTEGVALVSAAEQALPVAAPVPPAGEVMKQPQQVQANPGGAKIGAVPLPRDSSVNAGSERAGILGFLRCGLNIISSGCGRARLAAGAAAGSTRGWLEKQSRYTIEGVLATNPVYIPSPEVIRVLQSNSPRNQDLNALALDAKEAGEVHLAAAKILLQSLLVYRSAYAADGTTNGRALLIYTNRLFEDLLLYLVADYNKSVAKTTFQEATAPRPSGNSQVMAEGGIFGVYPIELIPGEVRDVLNAILRENPEKAKQYMLQPGFGGVGSYAAMPRLILRETSGTGAGAENNVSMPTNNLAAFDAQYQPAVKLANKIIIARAGRLATLFGQGRKGVAYAPGRNITREAIAGPNQPVPNTRAPRKNLSKLFRRLAGEPEEVGAGAGAMSMLTGVGAAAERVANVAGNVAGRVANVAGNVAGRVANVAGRIVNVAGNIVTPAAVAPTEQLNNAPDQEVSMPQGRKRVRNNTNNGLASQPPTQRPREGNVTSGGNRNRRRTQKKNKKNSRRSRKI